VKHAQKGQFLHINFLTSAHADPKPGYDNARATTPYRLQPRSFQLNRAMLLQASRRVVIDS